MALGWGSTGGLSGGSIGGEGMCRIRPGARRRPGSSLEADPNDQVAKWQAQSAGVRSSKGLCGDPLGAGVLRLEWRQAAWAAFQTAWQGGSLHTELGAIYGQGE